jgi:hypothetical protein
MGKTAPLEINHQPIPGQISKHQRKNLMNSRNYCPLLALSLLLLLARSALGTTYTVTSASNAAQIVAGTASGDTVQFAIATCPPLNFLLDRTYVGNGCVIEGTGGTLQLQGGTSTTFTNFVFDNTAFKTTDIQGIHFQGCTFQNFSGRAVDIYGGFTDSSITNCTFTNIGGDAAVFCDNGQPTRSDFSFNNFNGVGEGFHFSWGGTQQRNDCTITYNTFQNVSGVGAIEMQNDVDGLVIAYNWMDNWTPRTSHIGMSIATGPSSDGLSTSHHVRIHDNIIGGNNLRLGTADAFAGIEAMGPDVAVYNNFLSGDWGCFVLYGFTTPAWSFYNNVQVGGTDPTDPIKAENEGVAPAAANVYNNTWYPADSVPTPGPPVSPTAPVIAPGSVNGTGLTAQYYSDMNLVNLVLTQTDATVNFNWNGAAPVSGVSGSSFSARWTGTVMPLYSETYTFSTTSDDGVRLWVNGQQLVNDWTNHAPTQDSGQITLVAGQCYDLKVEYYQNGGGSMAMLSWSSAHQAQQIIPQYQLYPWSGANYTMTFTAWQSANFTSPQLADTSISGPAATPENDGIPNLLKYLYDINPTVPMAASDIAALSAGGTTTIAGTTYLTLNYRQFAGQTGINLNVQVSPDLHTWTTLTPTSTPISDTVQQTGTDSITNDPIMQVQVPFAGPKQFIRLNVVQP